MLIPLGLLAASSPAAGGSYELIETITVGSGGAASVTFSNLNTYSSTYQHLQIRAVARFNSSVTSNRLRIRINNEATAEPRHYLFGNGSTVGSGQGTTGTGSTVISDRIADNSVASGIFSPVIIDLLDPYETKNKTLRVFTGNPSTADIQISLQSILYTDTQAISTLALSGGDQSWEQSSFVQGSRFSIYGLKGA